MIDKHTNTHIKKKYNPTKAMDMINMILICI